MSTISFYVVVNNLTVYNTERERESERETERERESERE